MKLAISLATIVGFTVSLSAFEMNVNDEEVNSLLNTYDKETLTEISNELVKVASEEENIGEYELASSHYKRALKIREAIGLKAHKSFASILYLSSIAESKAGNFCEASIAAREASLAFKAHGVSKYEIKAANDHVAYGRACEILAFK
ncbi:tetratricopeptide repeat protein [Leptospira sp. 'Mane']|uniref:tetratricopeptide repeat protein n=1 Tax=Leptospira sp. 'Mane' TaxID=3387407 RepID=UPI00398A8711